MGVPRTQNPLKLLGLYKINYLSDHAEKQLLSFWQKNKHLLVDTSLTLFLKNNTSIKIKKYLRRYMFGPGTEAKYHAIYFHCCFGKVGGEEGERGE